MLLVQSSRLELVSGATEVNDLIENPGNFLIFLWLAWEQSSCTYTAL